MHVCIGFDNTVNRFNPITDGVTHVLTRNDISRSVLHRADNNLIDKPSAFPAAMKRVQLDLAKKESYV